MNASSPLDPEAIRRDFPAPTVHARNLFHLSAAMWDAWAAYDPVADGVFVTEKVEAERPDTDRERAISYAAHRLLSHRYRDAVGGARSLADFDDVMRSLCLPTHEASIERDPAAALGSRIAKRIIDDHWGTITVESKLGKGSTFTIKLPRAKQPQQ